MGKPRGRQAASKSSPGNQTIAYSSSSTPTPLARIASTSHSTASSRITSARVSRKMA